MLEIVEQFEGNLIGCVYSYIGGDDDELYLWLVLMFREWVGCLLNDKMLIGVVVSVVMNYGGLYLVIGYFVFIVVGILVLLI